MLNSPAHSPLVVGATVSAAIGAPVHARGAVDAIAAVVAASRRTAQAAPAVTAIAVTRRIAVIACGGARGIGTVARGAPVTAAVDASVVAILRGGMTNARKILSRLSRKWPRLGGRWVGLSKSLMRRARKCKP